MTFRVLYPDVDFTGEPDIERAAFGPGVTLDIFGAGRAAEVPPELWSVADAVVSFGASIDATVIEQLSRCRQIVRAGVGYDRIDIDAAKARGIPVCNTPDYGTLDVADHAIAMMLALTRGIVAFNEGLQRDPQGGWDFLGAPTVRRLAGLTFGVLGLGRIGTAAARRAQALAMDVLFFDPYRPPGTELALGFRRADNLEGLLRQADVLSLHTPLTKETAGIINADTLPLLRPGALLVNTARGALVDISSLLRALETGHLAGAALDVLPAEPPSSDDLLIAAWRAADSPLATRLILSPHAAFYSPASMIDLRRKSAMVAADYLRHGVLRNCVNGIA
jgi:lactate dehydrogenase-like 2-hydroxyacid dehydrogenase